MAQNDQIDGPYRPNIDGPYRQNNDGPYQRQIYSTGQNSATVQNSTAAVQNSTAVQNQVSTAVQNSNHALMNNGGPQVIYNLDKVILTGIGLQQGRVNHEAEFFIDGSNAGRGEWNWNKTILEFISYIACNRMPLSLNSLVPTREYFVVVAGTPTVKLIGFKDDADVPVECTSVTDSKYRCTYLPLVPGIQFSSISTNLIHCRASDALATYESSYLT